MKTVSSRQSLEEGIGRLLAGRHHDPFEILGCHRVGRQWRIRALLPGSAEASVTNTPRGVLFLPCLLGLVAAGALAVFSTWED